MLSVSVCACVFQRDGTPVVRAKKRVCVCVRACMCVCADFLRLSIRLLHTRHTRFSQALFRHLVSLRVCGHVLRSSSHDRWAHVLLALLCYASNCPESGALGFNNIPDYETYAGKEISSRPALNSLQAF